MNKNCDNCYWKVYKDMFCFNEKYRPKENICDQHDSMCECEDKAEYKYKGKYYCSDCLLNQFDVETSTAIHYHLNGEYLGSNDDLEEVILNLDTGIESIN